MEDSKIRYIKTSIASPPPRKKRIESTLTVSVYFGTACEIGSNSHKSPVNIDADAPHTEENEIMECNSEGYDNLHEELTNMLPGVRKFRTERDPVHCLRSKQHLQLMHDSTFPDKNICSLYLIWYNGIQVAHPPKRDTLPKSSASGA